jgi:DNA-binding transcriptional LysR family regulator
MQGVVHDLHRAGVRITPALELEGVEMVKRAVAANLGISILSRFTIEIEAATGRLCIVPVRGLQIQRVISVLYHKERRLPRGAQWFVDLITPPQAAGGTASHGQAAVDSHDTTVRPLRSPDPPVGASQEI